MEHANTGNRRYCHCDASLRLSPTAGPARRLVPLLAILTAFILASCGRDVVTTHFMTVQEARSKGAFERGWLPPVLPDSTRKITETNNVDVNTGHGSFEFSPSDYPDLVSQLTPAPPEIARHWQSQSAGGFAIFTYTADQAVWTVALHPDGRGIYNVELSR